MSRAKSAAALKASEVENSNPASPQVGASVIALHLIDEDLELNPRVDFDSDAAKAALDELAASIGDKGVLQPIMVRPSPTAGRYRIVMGARRFRAALQAGLLTIPAVVKDLDDDRALEAAVIENVQRQDMNPMEEARAYERMIANRRRADPDLSLLDAKAAVAVVVKRGVRMIELRLQLLTLPPIKQVEVAAGVTSAKSAIEWQRDQPKARKLDDATALAILEVAWVLSAKKNASVWDRADVRHDRPEDPAPGLLVFKVDYSDLKHKAGLTNGAFEHLQAVTGSEAPLVRANLEAAVRAARIAALPDLDGPARAAKLDELFKTKGNLTPWLNRPFEADPASLATRKREQAAQARRDRQWQKQQNEQRAAALAAQEARDADDKANAERAADILERVRAFETVAPHLGDQAFGEAFQGLFAGLNYKPPFTVGWDGQQVALFDAEGAEWRGGPQLLEGLRRIMAIALNRVLGLPAVSGPELTETPWAIKARDDNDPEHGGGEGGEQQDAEPSVEDDAAEPFEDPAPDDNEDDKDEVEGELEDAARDGDEPPAFLTRFAGVRAEART